MIPLAGIARNGGYAAAATTIYSVCQFLILVAFARYGELVKLGQYALALAITAPVFMFANMRLRFVVATDVTRKNTFADYMIVRMLSSAAALVAAVVVALLIVGLSEAFWLVFWMSVVRVVESLSDLVYGVYQRARRLEFMAGSMSLVGFGMSVAAVLCLEFGLPVVDIAISMLVVRVLVFLAYDLPRHRIVDSTSPLEGDRRAARATGDIVMPIVKRCWPLGLVALLVSLNTNIPRYFVEFLLGPESLGVFAALAYIPIAGYMIVGTVGQTLMPILAERRSKSDTKGLVSGAAQLCGLGAISGIIAISLGYLVGADFLHLVYGEQFRQYEGLFMWLLGAGAISYVVVGVVYVLTAMGTYYSQLLIYFADLLAVAILCSILMPQFGLNGGAIAMFASQLLQLAIAAALMVLTFRRIKG